MRALSWDGARLSVVEDAPEPRARGGMAVVRVHLAGICSTDLQILRGYMGFRGTLGHEFVGEVAQGPDHLVGRRVVGEINFACNRCPDCRAGRRRHCPARTVMGILGADGAFADLVRVPVENLHLVPDEIDDLRAVFVEPLAAASSAAAATAGQCGGRSLVLGAGKLGLLVAQVLASRGDDVQVLCRSARAHEVGKALGLATLSRERTPRGYDLVVDATGDAGGLAIALEHVRPQGTIVLKSTVAARHDLSLAPLVINEVSLIGSRCGDFPPALAALATNRLRVEPLIDAVMPLSRGIEAVERAGQPGALKVLVEVSR
ncbi:MAG: alcohol dehydrogenase catalytic domain-containing protein [Thermodesulfobacteriota bacterium]